MLFINQIEFSYFSLSFSDNFWHLRNTLEERFKVQVASLGEKKRIVTHFRLF